MLTILSISSTLSSTPICQQFAPRVPFFLEAACFLDKARLYSIFMRMLHWRHLQQLENMHNTLFKIMQETEALFVYFVDDENCFCLRRFLLALQADLQAKLQAEVPLVVRRLQ